MTQPTNERPAAAVKNIDFLKRQWRLYSSQDLPSHLAKLGTGAYLVTDLIPDRSLGMIIGDSGLGKTPLLYKLCLSVAAGVQFLGHCTQQNRVLYLDFENGLAEVDELINQLSHHLELSKPPDDFLFLSVHDCDARWGMKDHTCRELILEAKPRLVLIDPLTGLFPEAEEENSAATHTFQRLRALIAKTGTSIFCSHHTRKPSDEERDVRLGEVSLREWFLRARGARALINACDIRLAVDEPGLVGWQPNGQEELALIVGGFGRLRGELPYIHLSRIFNEDGEPVGYKRLVGADLLSNSDQ